MNRRGFVGLFIAVIAIPLAKVFGKKKKRKSLPSAKYLESIWLEGAPLGAGCSCTNKIRIQEEDIAFKASLSYCPKHGFSTSCWMCNPYVGSTESCGREHYRNDIPRADYFAVQGKKIWAINGEPIPTRISLVEAGIISAEKYLKI